MNRAAGVISALLLLSFGSTEARSQSHVGRRLLTMPVEINHAAGMFLIDTGANCTIIDSTFADQLGLKPSGAVSLEQNYSTGSSATVVAKHVRIGPKEWTDIQLAVQNLGTLSRIQGKPISGVVGTDLLASMTVRLSYSSGSAEVVDDFSDRLSLADLKRVPLKKAGGRYFVPVKIGPSFFEMLLDSGTGMTALSESAWRKLPSSWKPNGLVEGIESSGSPAGSLIACVPALQLGDRDEHDMVLHDHPLRVIAATQSGSFAETAFPGILGGDILERFEVTLDLQHSYLYLKLDPGFQPDPYEFVTVGIQFFKQAPDAFSVVAVWRNSPAEAAGVLVGDRIVSVSGHASADLGIDTFAGQLHGPAGKPVTLEVERATGRTFLPMKTRQLVCRSADAR